MESFLLFTLCLSLYFLSVPCSSVSPPLPRRLEFITDADRGFVNLDNGRSPPPSISRHLLQQQPQQSLPPPPPPPPPPYPTFNTKPNLAPFKPSIAVIVAVLTTMFSITFLLLLYAKHCKGRNGNSNSSSRTPVSTARKHSGIERTVIESLPMFRFASLRGQKDGLECAVCLNRFEPTEVLRLLPKCKHAFHVECVDTWLDAHSSCPLCRYRVHPEDVLLLEETKFGIQGSMVEPHKGDDGGGVIPESENPTEFSIPVETIHRISGRHSSAGERASHFMVQRPSYEMENRFSLSSPAAGSGGPGSRRSLDTCLKKKNESVAVGCFDRGCRKDGTLLPEPIKDADREDFLRRFDHRIILSNGFHMNRRWSDSRPSDLAYLRSQMIISDTSASMSASSPSPLKEQDKAVAEDSGDGRSVINVRSVSEITGLSRFGNRIEKRTPPTG